MKIKYHTMEFDRFASSYDSSFMGRGSRRFYADLIRELDVEDGDAVLDVGCGTGSVLCYIADKKQIKGFGIDVSENMVALARQKNPAFSFVAGDSARLPYADGSMDTVMACMAYHHFPNQAAFRREAWRVLKPGGSLYICDPRFPWLVRAFFNTFFKDAAFRTVRRNIADFAADGFRLANATKDFYVQVLCFDKPL